MSPEIHPRQRVSVEQEPYGFLVLVDAEPVLRCTAQRDALRYAVMIRKALLRADLHSSDGTSRGRPLQRRKIRN
jgi:hypothetical protein